MEEECLSQKDSGRWTNLLLNKLSDLYVMYGITVRLPRVKKQAVLLKQGRREMDLNDLVNYCLMKRLGVEDIYTNDQHFKQLPDISPHF